MAEQGDKAAGGELDPLYAYVLRHAPPGAGETVTVVDARRDVLRIVLTRSGNAVIGPSEDRVERARGHFTDDVLARMRSRPQDAPSVMEEFGARDVEVQGAFYTRPEVFRPQRDHTVFRLSPELPEGGPELGPLDLGEAYVVVEAGQIACRGLLLALSGYPGVCAVGNVHTVPRYRRKGMARSIVSAVTEGILERGELPVLEFSLDDEAMLKICRDLGYRRFALEVDGRLSTGS